MNTTLAGKALVPVGLAVTGFMVVCCLLLYSVIRDDMHHREVAYAASLADTVLKSTRYAMLKSDRDTLATVISNVGGQNGVDHVRIFNKRGRISFSSRAGEVNSHVDKKEEGCIICHKGDVPATTLGTMQQARTYRKPDGLNVIAITAPIYNAPDCTAALCHVHSPEQQVLGTLDIGLSLAEHDRSLAQLTLQMAVFSLMCLVLTVGGVTALLRRNVFLPIGRLRRYVERLADGEGAAEEPPHLPHDLDVIADRCRDVARNPAGKGDGTRAAVRHHSSPE